MNINVSRMATHLLMTRGKLRRAFSAEALGAIDAAIKASEAAHHGQIRFALEGALDGAPLFTNQSARARAIDVFSSLRIWDTQHKNGVLIYLLLADRDVEIVADRAIHALVGVEEWEKICRMMEAAFARANYQAGVIGGIQAVTQHLVKHFPVNGAARNELPDASVVL